MASGCANLFGRMHGRSWFQFAILFALALASPPELGAARCGAGASAQDKARASAQDHDELDARLRSPEAEVRRRATAQLVQVGTAPALERLLGLLADPEGMVADEAQLGLGAWPHAEHAARILAALDQRRGEVPLRAAEALGRLPFALGADALAGILGGRELPRLSLVCFSIERLAVAGRIAGDPSARLVPALEALLRERDGRVPADALLALAKVQPEQAAARLRSFAADGREQLRAAVAIAAGGLPEAEGSELAAALLADPRAAVRVRAAQSTARFGNRAAACALAERLGAETNPRVVRELTGLLRELSGLRHGADARPWQAWAAALAEDWRAGARQPRSKEPAGAATAAFAGLAIQSERVAFLIDLSGSMWDTREGGRTRKQAVDAELLQTLRALPQSAHFNLIPFTNEPLPWRKGLVPALERNVRDALKSFEGQRSRGQGNYWSALLLALEDPELDTLIVFGDGRPSGGPRWNLELMRVLLEHENRYRAVVLDAVLVDLSRRIEGFWDALCADTGGTCLGVGL